MPPCEYARSPHTGHTLPLGRDTNGVGFFSLHNEPEFKQDEEALEPSSFVDFNTDDFGRAEDFTFKYFQEELSFWKVDGDNLFVNNHFSGVGYVRTVKPVKTDENGNLPRSKRSGKAKFIPKPDEEMH